MARSMITSTAVDLTSDTGGVLWSLVQGEQLEYPVTLSFITNAGAGYVYEAVVMEGLNVLGSTEHPTSARPGRVNTTLVVRVPTERGVWSAETSYSREDVVSYNALYYKLASGSSRVSATIPSSDSLWVEYIPNKIYVQFPSTLSKGGTPWAVQPTVVSNVYGFFELSVTEPGGGVFTRTWKPMRGLVELLYSPTDLVT